MSRTKGDTAPNKGYSRVAWRQFKAGLVRQESRKDFGLFCDAQKARLRAKLRRPTKPRMICEADRNIDDDENDGMVWWMIPAETDLIIRGRV